MRAGMIKNMFFKKNIKTVLFKKQKTCFFYLSPESELSIKATPHAISLSARHGERKLKNTENGVPPKHEKTQQVCNVCFQVAQTGKNCAFKSVECKMAPTQFYSAKPSRT